jgi:hypothetical protein
MSASKSLSRVAGGVSRPVKDTQNANSKALKGDIELDNAHLCRPSGLDLPF